MTLSLGKRAQRDASIIADSLEAGKAKRQQHQSPSAGDYDHSIKISRSSSPIHLDEVDNSEEVGPDIPSHILLVDLGP